MKWLVIVLVAAACGHDVASVPDSALPPPIDAPPARLEVMPASLDFQAYLGCVPADPMAIVVTNTGGVETAEVAAQLVGVNASEFAIASSSCATLAPAEHCELRVTFAPVTPGAHVANLVITAGPDTGAMVNLTGVAFSGGVLSISPTNHDFSNVVVGAISSPQVFTVSSCSPFTTGAFIVATGGVDPDQFVKTADTCTGAALGPLGMCSITVAFAPTSVGARSASFDFAANPGGLVSASVSGTGLAPPAPKLAISPSAIDFGSVGIGQTSPDPLSCLQPPSTRVTVTNTGTSTSAPLAAVVSGAGFAIATDLCSSQSLDPGGACTIDAKFTAGGTFGAQTGTLTVTAASLVVHANLAAVVVSDAGGFIDANPSSLAFGTVVIGTTSATSSFTVTNNGACPTGPLQLDMIGLNATEFFFVPSGTCATAMLANGQSCRVDIRFAPVTASGSRTATAIVSGSPGGTVMVGLDGVAGSTFPLVLAPNSHDFGSIDLGSCPSIPTSFTLTNNNGLTFGPITTSIVGTNSASFAIEQDGCNGVTLPSGGMCTVTVAFVPMSTVGSKSAQLQFVGSSLSVQAALSGTAISAAGVVPSPCSLAFGTVAPGSTATRTITLTNDGATTSGPIHVAVSGADAGLFSTTNDTCTNATLANLQTCTVDFVFAPTTTGARTATAVVSSAPGGMENIPLTGD